MTQQRLMTAALTSQSLCVQGHVHTSDDLLTLTSDTVIGPEGAVYLEVRTCVPNVVMYHSFLQGVAVNF